MKQINTDCPKCKGTRQEIQNVCGSQTKCPCSACKGSGIIADYINFGDFCRNDLDMQCQYGSYLLEGLAGHPKLGEGLRIGGDDWNYHSYTIHKDDAKIFKERVEKWKHQYD